MSDPANSQCDNAGQVGPFGPSPRDFFTIDQRTGEVRCFDFGQPVASPAIQQGGDGLRTNRIAQLRSPLERTLIEGSARYKLLDELTLFARGKFAHTRSTAIGQPVFDVPNPVLSDPITISIENPFLPTPIRQALNENDRESVTLTRAGFDLGFRNSENERDLFQFRIGAEGNIFDNVEYEMYFSHGEVDVTFEETNRLETRDQVSLDAVRDSNGDIVCRISLPPDDPRFVPGISEGERQACAPRNPFALNSSPEAIDFLMQEFLTRGKLEQNVFNSSVTVPAFELPGGTVTFVGGFEWREEQSRSVPDSALQRGQDFPGGNPVQPVEGDFRVKEFFGEIFVPLVKQEPFAHDLSVEAAFRQSDYTTVGSTTTYKFGGDWAPIPDIRFRGTYSQSVRAPNVGELFAGESVGTARVTDPCDRTNLEDQTNPDLLQNRLENCAEVVPGDPRNFDSFAELTAQRVANSGNPNLVEEVSDTATLGLVLQPRAIPTLDFTVDYWSIEIGDAINRFPLDDVLANCVDSENLDNLFCSLIERFPVSDSERGGQIKTIRSQDINVASLEASGIDFEANYLADLNGLWDVGGALRFNAVVTYAEKIDFFPNQERPEEVEKEAGEAGNPHWLGTLRTTYKRGPLTLHWEIRYVGESDIDNEFGPEATDVNTISSQLYNRITSRYQVNDWLELSAGIQNLTDNDPPSGPPDEIGAGVGENGSLYDNQGRRYFLGATARF